MGNRLPGCGPFGFAMPGGEAAMDVADVGLAAEGTKVKIIIGETPGHLVVEGFWYKEGTAPPAAL